MTVEEALRALVSAQVDLLAFYDRLYESGAIELSDKGIEERDRLEDEIFGCGAVLDDTSLNQTTRGNQ